MILYAKLIRQLELGDSNKKKKKIKQKWHSHHRALVGIYSPIPSICH